MSCGPRVWDRFNDPRPLPCKPITKKMTVRYTRISDRRFQVGEWMQGVEGRSSVFTWTRWRGSRSWRLKGQRQGQRQGRTRATVGTFKIEGGDRVDRVDRAVAGQPDTPGSQGGSGGRGSQGGTPDVESQRARTPRETWVESHTPYRVEWWRSTRFEYWILRLKVIVAMTWVIVCPRRFFMGIEWWFGPATESVNVRSDAQKGVGG